MLAQPLQRDYSYENGCEAEDETEEPDDVDADIRGCRFACGARGSTHKDQKILNLVFPCFTSRFILSYPRFQ